MIPQMIDEVPEQNSPKGSGTVCFTHTASPRKWRSGDAGPPRNSAVLARFAAECGICAVRIRRGRSCDAI